MNKKNCILLILISVCLCSILPVHAGTPSVRNRYMVRMDAGPAETGEPGDSVNCITLVPGESPEHDLTPGDVVCLGTADRDSDPENKEPMEWVVLQNYFGIVRLVCSYLPDYMDEVKNNEWSNQYGQSLPWLQNRQIQEHTEEDPVVTFFLDAFEESERSCITEVKLWDRGEFERQNTNFHVEFQPNDINIMIQLNMLDWEKLTASDETDTAVTAGPSADAGELSEEKPEANSAEAEITAPAETSIDVIEPTEEQPEVSSAGTETAEAAVASADVPETENKDETAAASVSASTGLADPSESTEGIEGTEAQTSGVLSVVPESEAPADADHESGEPAAGTDTDTSKDVVAEELPPVAEESKENISVQPDESTEPSEKTPSDPLDPSVEENPGDPDAVTATPMEVPPVTSGVTLEPTATAVPSETFTAEPEITETPVLPTNTPAVPAENTEPVVTLTPENGEEKTEKKPAILLILLGAAAVAGAGAFITVGRNRKKIKKEENMSGSNITSAITQMPEPIPQKDESTSTVKLQYKQAVYRCADCGGQGKRNYQEDSWWCPTPVPGHSLCAVLADGMGGMDNGAESSRIAIDTFKSNVSLLSPDSDIPATLKMISEKANETIYQTNSAKDMNGGSTLVCTYVFDNKLYWISIGDSRIYLYRDGMLAAVNEEHELEHRMYNAMLNGRIDLIDVRDMQYGELRKLTSNLGRDEITLIDQNFSPYYLQEGDKILLCSDGVSGTLSEAEIADCLSDPDPAINCSRIEKMVIDKDKKGQDNYSAIVVAFGTELVK